MDGAVRRVQGKLKHAPPRPRVGLILISRYTLTLRRLSGQQERLDESTLAAHSHPREPLVPLSLRHLGLAVQPLRQQLQLTGGNLPAVDAIEQMLKQSRRNILAADLRHVPALDS